MSILHFKMVIETNLQQIDVSRWQGKYIYIYIYIFFFFEKLKWGHLWLYYTPGKEPAPGSA